MIIWIIFMLALISILIVKVMDLDTKNKEQDIMIEALMKELHKRSK